MIDFNGVIDICMDAPTISFDRVKCVNPNGLIVYFPMVNSQAFIPAGHRILCIETFTVEDCETSIDIATAQ